MWPTGIGCLFAGLSTVSEQVDRQLRKGSDNENNPRFKLIKIQITLNIHLLTIWSISRWGVRLPPEPPPVRPSLPVLSVWPWGRGGLRPAPPTPPGRKNFKESVNFIKQCVKINQHNKTKHTCFYSLNLGLRGSNPMNQGMTKTSKQHQLSINSSQVRVCLYFRLRRRICFPTWTSDSTQQIIPRVDFPDLEPCIQVKVWETRRFHLFVLCTLKL